MLFGSMTKFIIFINDLYYISYSSLEKSISIIVLIGKGEAAETQMWKNILQWNQGKFIL